MAFIRIKLKYLDSNYIGIFLGTLEQTQNHNTQINMRKILEKLKRKITGAVNTDYKSSIGTPRTRTVNNIPPAYTGAKTYTNPFN